MNTRTRIVMLPPREIFCFISLATFSVFLWKQKRGAVPKSIRISSESFETAPHSVVPELLPWQGFPLSVDDPDFAGGRGCLGSTFVPAVDIQTIDPGVRLLLVLRIAYSTTAAHGFFHRPLLSAILAVGIYIKSADISTIHPHMGAVVPSALTYKLNNVCSSGSCPDNRPQPALESHQDAQKSITRAL